MSRPSSTAPGGRRAKSRWNSSSAARTCGMRATIEAASPAPGSRRLGIVERGRIERAGGRGGLLLVIERAAQALHVAGHGAVEQAGVEVMQAEARGDALGQRALARCGRAVDGDDHGRIPRSGAPKLPIGPHAPSGSASGWMPACAGHDPASCRSITARPPARRRSRRAAPSGRGTRGSWWRWCRRRRP